MPYARFLVAARHSKAFTRFHQNPAVNKPKGTTNSQPAFYLNSCIHSKYSSQSLTKDVM